VRPPRKRRVEAMSNSTPNSPWWINEFIRCLNQPSSAHLQIDGAIHIKHEHLFTKIYKYRSVNTYALDNLTNDPVWVGPATSYNDPYDSAITMSFKDMTNASLMTTLRLGSTASPIMLELRTILSFDELSALSLSSNPLLDLGKIILSKSPKLTAVQIDDGLATLFDAYEKSTEKTVRGFK
jgi:hypothetical protein